MKLDIPKAFYSDLDDKLHKECKVCNCDLSNGATPYTIEKAYKRVDDGEDVTLFEIIICMPCAEKQSAKMSDHSRKYIETLMSEYKLIEKRNKLWDTEWENEWKSKCLLTDKSVKVNDEYHIVGQFRGNQILPGLAPFIIGQDVLLEMQENLSAETKEEMDRFGQQFTAPDPNLRALLSDHSFVFV